MTEIWYSTAERSDHTCCLMLMRRPPAGVSDGAIASMCLARVIVEYYGPTPATQRTVGGGFSKRILDYYGMWRYVTPSLSIAAGCALSRTALRCRVRLRVFKGPIGQRMLRTMRRLSGMQLHADKRLDVQERLRPVGSHKAADCSPQPVFGLAAASNAAGRLFCRWCAMHGRSGEKAVFGLPSVKDNGPNSGLASDNAITTSCQSQMTPVVSAGWTNPDVV